MQFSYSAIWDEAVRLLKTHASLLVAIAGAFLFLPTLLAAYFIPLPEAKTLGEFTEAMSAYLQANWPVRLLIEAVGAAGSIAMLLLLFDRGGISVGEALRRSLPLLVPYIVLQFLSNLMIAAGFFLFVIPGFYLLGRLAPVTAAFVAENLRNPVEALRRGFALTRGRGWAIFGLLLLIFVTGYLLVFAVSSVIGSLLLLAAGQQIGGILTLILDAALGAGLATVLLAVYASVYLHLSAVQPAGRTSGS